MSKLIKRIILSFPRQARSQLLPLLLTIRIGGLAIATLALWGFVEIADEVLDRQSEALDTSILLALRNLHTPLLNQIMIGMTFVGEPTVLLAICAILGIWFLVQKRRAEASIVAIATFGGLVLNVLLKELFGRARPALWERVVDVTHYSFPSGHAMLSLVVYGIIGYLFVNHFPTWQQLIVTLTSLLITGIGLSRLYLGVHWPTDVLAGYAAGLVWLITCIFSLETWKVYRSKQSRLEDKSLSPEESAL